MQGGPECTLALELPYHSSGTGVPACIADLRNLLKVHNGNLVFLSEEAEDTCEVVQNYISSLQPPVSLISAFTLLKAALSRS